MSAPDSSDPQHHEEIHLPGPTWMPILLAFGVTLTLVGLTTIIAVSVLGAILTVSVLVRWIVVARRDTQALPLDHE